MSTGSDEIVSWLRANPSEDGIELRDLAEQFGMAPERLRDRLRRLVEQGLLTQSAPVTGVADANPSYQLADTD